MSPEFSRRAVGGSRRAPRASPQGSSRGRPRDTRIDTEVVESVLSALNDGGYRKVTMNGIARRVGRARSSLYRRWPSKGHLVAYAVVSELGDNPAADTGSTSGDLEAAVGTLRRAFAGPLGAALPGLVADTAQDAALTAIIRAKVLDSTAPIDARGTGAGATTRRSAPRSGRGSSAGHADRTVLFPHAVWPRACQARQHAPHRMPARKLPRTASARATLSSFSSPSLPSPSYWRTRRRCRTTCRDSTPTTPTPTPITAIIAANGRQRSRQPVGS